MDEFVVVVLGAKAETAGGVPGTAVAAAGIAPVGAKEPGAGATSRTASGSSSVSGAGWGTGGSSREAEGVVLGASRDGKGEAGEGLNEALEEQKEV